MRAPRIAATHQECKVVKISVGAMAFWFLLVVFATKSNKAQPPEAMPSRANEYCSAPLTSGDEGGSDVTSVTVVVRHGARSGIATDTQDWKCGLGALKTHIKRYGGTSWQVTTRSTNYQRTKASASAFLDGFFGGRVPKDAWPSFRERASEEPMFGVEGEDGKGIRCVRAAANAKRQREAWTADPELADAVAAIEEAAANPTDVADVAYSRHCDKTGCLRDATGACVTGNQAGALLRLADKFYYGRYNGNDGGREASRLGMHPFLSELLQNFRDDLHEKQRRLRLYAGHDTVVAPLLAALGIFDGKWPPLASRIVFELREGGALRILFNGRDVSEEACPGAFGDDPEGGPPGARGCHVAAFEARVASLLGGAASFDEACGN